MVGDLGRHGLGESTRAGHGAELDTLGRLGDTEQAGGRTDAAATAWRLALTILVELDRPGAAALDLKLRELAAR